MKQYLEVGKITNTHGLKGEMKMELWCDGVEYLEQFKVLYLDDKGENKVNVNSIRAQKNFALVMFNEINSIESAEKLKNKVIYCNRSDAIIEENAHYVQDVIGCYVVDVDTDEEYGKISDILNYGSSDIFEVKNGKKTHLIPNVPDIVKEINTEYLVVKIKALKGLFDED